MFAIVKTGGKQYRVEAGKTYRVEKLELPLGGEFELNEVLFVGGDSYHIGNPLVAGAKIVAVVTQQDKGPKILVFKKKRRKKYRKMQGHRQPFTEIFIKKIAGPQGEVDEAQNEPHVVDPQKTAAKKASFAKKVEELKAKGENTPKEHKPAKKAAAKKSSKGSAKKGKKTAAKKKTKKKTSKK